MKRLLAIILLNSLFFLVGCKDEKCGRNRDNYRYDLEADVLLEPIKEAYSVGDTIRVEVTFPRQILDRNNQVMEELLSLDIRHGWWISKLDNVPEIRPDVINDITFYPELTTMGAAFIEGGSNLSSVVGELEKLENGDHAINYVFTLNSTGYYAFTFGLFIEDEDQVDNPIELVNECGNGHFQIYYRIRNMPENNIVKYCESEPPTGLCLRENLEAKVEDHERTGGLTLVVTE